LFSGLSTQQGPLKCR